MRYQYPKLNNSLVFRRLDENRVEAFDVLREQRRILSLETVRFIKGLDGRTNPYSVPTAFSKGQIKVLLNELLSCGVLQLSSTRREGRGTFFHALWEPKLTPSLQKIAFFWNLLLQILWIPTLVVGIGAFLLRFAYFEFTAMWWGLPLGLIIGVVLHEFSHLFAAATYGAPVREMGVALFHFVLPGFYVIYDERAIQYKMQRIQVNAAGVEMNFLLAGLCLLLGAVVPSVGGVLLLSACLNVFFGLMNLTFLGGSDGTALLGEFLGVDDILLKAKAVVLAREKRGKVTAQGADGVVTVAVCYALMVLQVALPILLIANVLEVILWLV